MAGLIHHYNPRPALPYVTDVSPLENAPHFKSGSNVLTSIKGYLEKRPGNADFEATPTTFTGKIKRLFGWSRWDGTFYVMANEITATQSKIWKLKVGTDASFGLVATSSTITPFDFVVANNNLYFGNGVDMLKYDGTTGYIWGIEKPAAAPGAALSAGTVNTVAGGFSYKYAFGNSSSGHIGQISDASAYTGNFTSQQIAVTGSNTADPQVDKVHIYRTADGGATYYELPNSPIAYVSSWSITDTASTASLNTSSQASLAGQNAKPTPSSMLTFFAGRIWTAVGDTVYYSNFEELINGLGVESFALLNTYKFGTQVTGLAVVQRALLIFTRNGIWKITGDSKSSFLLQPFKRRNGVDNQANVAVSPEDAVAWIDLSGTIYMSDATDRIEIGKPIRSDIATFTQTSTSMAFHYDGVRRWLVVCDFALQKRWVFDMDLNQWMVPWSIGGASIASVETASGVYTLLSTTNAGTGVYKMTPSTYTDGASTYSENLVTNLMEMGDGRGPGEVSFLKYVSIDRNTVTLGDVLVLTDDDPTQGSFTSIFDQEIDSSDRVPGVFTVQKWYPMDGSPVQITAERIALMFSWIAQTSNWKLYAIDIITEKAEDIYAPAR